jgi:tetratricopeptide (TPR) repeat protein
MWSHLFEWPCPVLALETLGGDGQPVANHHGSWTLSIVVLAILVAYGYHCYAVSDDRRVLLYKWAASVGLGSVMLVLVFMGQRHPKLALLFIIPCVILSFVWLPNLVGYLLRPLTGAFDGGYDEVEPKPFYFIATAKRAKSLPQEAIADVLKQLEKFPGDVAGIMLLASIQAEDLHDLPAAQATLNELLQQTDLTPQQRATALHTLADWQLQLARDATAARETLERIVRALPDSQYAHAAEQRIATLEGAAETMTLRDNVKYEVRQRERDVGLRENTPTEPVALDAGLMATQYVHQLENHPADTATREKLAVLYAEHFDRLDLAADQLEQLIALPDETPKHVARWLNLLATLHITVGHDEASARKTLVRIVEKFPKGALAEVAALRMASLRNEMKSGTATPSKTLGVYEKDVGLKKAGGLNSSA